MQGVSAALIINSQSSINLELKDSINLSTEISLAPEGLDLKIECQATNAKYLTDAGDELNTFKSDFYTNDISLPVVFKFTQQGLQKIYCTSYNRDGEVIEEARKLIDVYVYYPFLQKPYLYDDSLGISSFMDHNKPDYSTNNALVRFSGPSIPDYGCSLGYNCYDGHEGIDYRTKSKPIRSAAAGKLRSIDSTASQPVYGNTVEIEHDLNDDGKIDYVTRYAHLASFHNELGEVGDLIGAGVVLGTSGGTGTGGGGQPHLHFDVRKIYYDENGSEVKVDTADSSKYGQLIDPYGWWWYGEDPWSVMRSYRRAETIESEWGIPKSSYFLWNSSNVVDDRDDGFQFMNISSSLWSKHDLDSAYNKKAISTKASHNPSRKWDNWAIWVAQFNEDDQEYIPFVSIPKKLPDTFNSSSVKYKIFSKDQGINNTEYPRLITDITFDQESTGITGGWFNLPGLYRCDRYNSCALMVFDETDKEDQRGKNIWADAVEWVKVDRSLLFVDVPESTWYFPYIEKVYDENVVKGYEHVLDNETLKVFRPKNPITRAEFLKMSLAAVGVNNLPPLEEGSEKPYEDVPVESWYAPYVDYAKEHSYISTSSEEFRPNDSINRAEATKLVVEISGEGVLEDLDTVFVDVVDGDWFHDYVLTALDREIINGYVPSHDCNGLKEDVENTSRYFCPQKDILRGEAAKIITKGLICSKTFLDAISCYVDGL